MTEANETTAPKRFKHRRDFDEGEFWNCRDLAPELREKANYYFGGPDGVERAMDELSNQIDILTQDTSCYLPSATAQIFWTIVAFLECPIEKLT